MWSLSGFEAPDCHYVYALCATVHRPCLFLMGRLLHMPLLLAYSPFFFMLCWAPALGSVTCNVHTRDADKWFVPQLATYSTCHGISLLLRLTMENLFSIVQHVTVHVSYLVLISCLCHNGDYTGTCARSCLTIDELLAEQCVHMHNSYGPASCSIL